LLLDQIQLNAGPIPHKIKRGQSDALFMIKPSGSIARKRKKRRKKTRSRRALYFVSNVPKSAGGRFRSFETGDYSNEIMGLASAAGFCRVSQGINRDEPDTTSRAA
jgi:hypothetical protein